MTVIRASFGRTTPPSRRAMEADEAIALMKSGCAGVDTILPYGNGRSYGDSCQTERGILADMRGLNRISGFNPETGVVTAEAGVLLSDVIARAAPHGYFPAVVPGTQFVTVGGAIANDVHGKNHHRRGTFGCHVTRIDLLRSDGRVYTCTPDANARLFQATIGGMGLTGLILSASFRLMRVPSLDIEEKVTPFASLGEYFDQAEAADRDNEYAVAWLDQLATGRHAGRGLLLTGNHARNGAMEAAGTAPRLSVPFQPPLNVLNRPFLRAFNMLYRWKRSRGAPDRTTSYREFFFPLDGVANWNRLYGPKGLFQHQSVIPPEAAREVVPELLAATTRAGQGSFLTVLKRFGEVTSPGMLSFARPGYTLTLDFPNRGARTLELLRQLDAITVAAGGAVNPYKDARMAAAVFASSFPDWQRLEFMRDQAFMSSFWERTAMRLKSRERGQARIAV